MMTGTGGSVNNKDAEDVLLIQEVLTTRDQRMGTGNRDLYSSFKVGGTWESSGVPNIELAMMQLIHSRKLWKQTLSLHAGTTGIPPLWKRCLPSKDPTYSTKIKLLRAAQAKDHGEEALDGRALRVYHVA
jgi:hypothetical protein